MEWEVKNYLEINNVNCATLNKDPEQKETPSCCPTESPDSFELYGTSFLSGIREGESITKDTPKKFQKLLEIWMAKQTYEI